MRPRPIPALLASAALAATALVGVAPSAHASDYCDFEDSTAPELFGYRPGSVTIGKTGSALVKFGVDANDECGIDDWMISGPRAFAYKKSPSDTIYGFSNSDAGNSHVDVRVYDRAYNATAKRYSFRLLRAAHWNGFNASPEPVRKGGTVTVKGTLVRADWDDNAYRVYGKQKAKVQFRGNGQKSWKTVATTTVDKTGRVSKRIAVKGTTGRDGSYRLSFAGNSVTGSATSQGDYVDVR